jgi:hypothetical protein
MRPVGKHGGTRWARLAGRSAVLLVGLATLARAQRPVTSPIRSAARADTVEHSPFIPGGHWRPGRPAPVPEPVPDHLAVPPSAVTDAAGYFARPNGMLLRPGTTTYSLTLQRDTLVIPLGIRTVTVSDGMLAGVSDWLVAESRTGSAIPTSDSLHLRRADLMPMRWTARNGLSQLAVSFTPDSMFAALQDYQGRGSFASPLPPGALVTPGMVDRLLELLPLGPGYRAIASLVMVDSGRPRAIPATISVEGEARVTLTSPTAELSSQPADSQQVAPTMIVDQAADCWLVVLRADTLEKRYWVSKSPQRVVKTEQALASGVLTELLRPTP